MASRQVFEKPPTGARDLETNQPACSDQGKTFPGKQDDKTCCVKRRSTFGIDRPLTPAKVSNDKSANRLSLCSNAYLSIEEENRAGEIETPSGDAIPAKRLSFDEDPAPPTSAPPVASASTVILRRKPLRQPRPTSMFSQSEAKKPLVASKSYDSNMFSSTLSPKPFSTSHEDLGHLGASGMSRQASFPSLFSKGSTLPASRDVSNPVKKLNGLFRRDKVANSKGVIMRKKKDNLKDTSQKTHNRKSLPAIFASKSNSNFNLFKNPFSRSPTTKEFPELPTETERNMVYFRRRSLPFPDDDVPLLEEKSRKGGRKNRTPSNASQSLANLLHTQGNLFGRRRNKGGNFKCEVNVSGKSSNLEEKETEPRESERLHLIWPPVRPCNHNSGLDQSNRKKKLRGRISAPEVGSSSNPSDQIREIAKKLDRVTASSDDLAANSVRLRARRAAVSSVAPSATQPPSDDSCDSDSEMPMKKNTFKITAKFIGSLQKHVNQKAKAEQAAAAVALAAKLTDPNRNNLDSESCRDNFSEHSEKGDDMFALLEKAQGSRLEEQRYSLNSTHSSCPDGECQGTSHYPTIHDVIRRNGPRPQVIPPPQGGYWAQGFHSESRYLQTPPAYLQPTDKVFECCLECDDVTTIYRDHFFGKEHINMYAYDETNEEIGCLIMSIKYEPCNDDNNNLGQHRILLRCRKSSWTGCFPVIPGSGGPVQWARFFCEDLNVDRFYPIICPNAWEALLEFDEHTVNHFYKFGVVYQQQKQTTEEEIFSNCEESPAFREFLDFLGETVNLQGFNGFRGGLDVSNGHTGENSIYHVFRDREVMFHVSTKLPYAQGDKQQLQRKRHIGNDIVTIVFQDDETPFVPNMITSHFLHAYIVIQPIDPCTENCRYKVSVTCRGDVPDFDPPLPEPAVFRKNADFKDWLYCKLMNAEWACYRSEKFAKLQGRTRCMLLEQLYEDLTKGTELMCGFSLQSHEENLSASMSDLPKEGGGGFFEAFKKITRASKPQEEPNGSPILTRKLFNQESKQNLDGKKKNKIERTPTNGSQDRKSNVSANQDSGHVSDVTYERKSIQGSLSSLNGSPKERKALQSNFNYPSCGSISSLEYDTGMESLASSQTNSWPRPCKGPSCPKLSSCSEKKIQNDLSTSELHRELERLRRKEKEFEVQSQELVVLRSQVKEYRDKETRRISNSNPSLVRKIDNTISSTEEHFI